jgi:hypothetical protein
VLSDSDCLAAATALCDTGRKPVIPNDEQRDMQRGMADARFRFLEPDNELRSITTLHWMTFLAAVVRCGGAVATVSAQVRDFFSEKDKASVRIEQLSKEPEFPLPEIHQVFKDASMVLD